MIDLLELKSETKHAVGFKNNFYKIRICYSKFLNNINYSLLLTNQILLAI